MKNGWFFFLFLFVCWHWNDPCAPILLRCRLIYLDDSMTTEMVGLRVDWHRLLPTSSGSLDWWEVSSVVSRRWNHSSLTRSVLKNCGLEFWKNHSGTRTWLMNSRLSPVFLASNCSLRVTIVSFISSIKLTIVTQTIVVLLFLWLWNLTYLS